MSLIFAVDSDKRQSAVLASLLRSHVNADLVQSGSATEGLQILQGRIPDLILTSPLLSPRDEATLANHLRELGDGAAHVHTLTIPVIEAAASKASKKKPQGLLGGLRREKDSKPSGCDPAVFAREVALYLDRAVERRTSGTGTRESSEAHIAYIDARPSVQPAVETAPEPVSAGLSLDDTMTDESAEPALSLDQVLKLVVSNDDAPRLVEPAPAVAVAAAPVSRNVEAATAVVRIPDAAEAAGLSAQELAELTAPLPQGRPPDAIRAPGPRPRVPVVEIDTCDDVQLLENQFAATPLEPEPVKRAPLEPEPVMSVPLEPPIYTTPAMEAAAEAVSATPIDLWPAPPVEELAPSWPWVDDQAAAPLADVLLEACAQVAATMRPPEPEPEPEPAPLLLDLESLELIGAAAHRAGLDALSLAEPSWVAEPVEAVEEKVEEPVFRRRRERTVKPVRKPPQKTGRPAQDEWGMYDPAQCGPAALFGDHDEEELEDDAEPPRPAGRVRDVVY